MENVVAEQFAKDIGEALLREQAIRPYLGQLRVLSACSDQSVRELWDAYDGCNDPLGFSGEAIHLELNRRGLGDYCAV